jgi:hypothetical protein
VTPLVAARVNGDELKPLPSVLHVGPRPSVAAFGLYGAHSASLLGDAAPCQPHGGENLPGPVLPTEPSGVKGFYLIPQTTRKAPGLATWKSARM